MTKPLQIALLATGFNQGTGPATWIQALRDAIELSPEIQLSGQPGQADLIHLVDAKRADLRGLDSLAAPVIADFHDHYWCAFRPYPCPDLPLRWLRQKQLLHHHLAVIRRARALIVHSETVARAVAQVMSEQKIERPPAVHVVPYPVRPPIGGSESVGARAPSPAPTPLILMVGRDRFRKGFTVIAKALPHVCKAIPGARLLILGDEYLHTRAAARLLARGLPVEFLPAVTPAELDGWYGRASVLVLPSFEEAFGIAPVEAMARDLPVVAARVGGIPEAVEHDVSGLLHPRGDHQDLAEKIIAVLTDPDLRARLIAGGRERARTFNRDRTARALEAAYRDAREDS